MEYPYQFAVLLLDGNGTSESTGQLGVKMDGTEPFTIDAWVKTESAPGKRTILAQKDGFDFGIDGQRLYFHIAGYPAVYSSMSNGAISPREWVHVCAVYDMSGVLLYINGVSDTYTAISGRGSYKEGPVIFGQNLQGMIRQVRIFQCALTEEQVNGYMMFADLSDVTFRELLAVYYDFSQIPAVERIKENSVVLKETAEQQLFFSGISFEGNAFLTIDDEPKINPAGGGNDSYTVQAWFFLMPNEFEDRYTIFANGDVNAVAGMSLFIERIDGAYYIKALRANGTQEDDVVVSGDAVPPAQWINVAVTYDVDTMKLYVNGKISNSASGLFPIPVQLMNQQPRIGSEVIENDVNGQDWFSGNISRLDIWERALSEEEILKFALEQPDMDAEGILGCYFFDQKDTGNLCTGKLLGERNTPELKEISVKVQKGMCFTEPEYGGAGMADPLPFRYLEQFRKTALEQRNGDNDHLVYTVTSHIIGDTIYFVAHERDVSYTVCYGGIEDIDALMQWYIELILIVIGGVVKIIFGAKIQSSNKVLLELIKRATRHPCINTALIGKITLKTIIEIFKILYNAGFLIDMFRAALAGFSFWKVSWMIAKIIILATASMAGGWAYYAAALAELVVELVAHAAKYPGKEEKKEIPCIGLSAIRFQSNYTVQLKLNARESAPVPEWTSDIINKSHTAYNLSALSDNCPVIIQASFRSDLDTAFHVEVRCVEQGAENIFGSSDIVNICMQRGVSEPQYVNFTFNAHHINNGVRYAETEFSWQFKNSFGEWQQFAVSRHNIYVILTEPKRPWNLDQKPWCEVLKYACTWGKGSTEEKALAESIITKVNEGLEFKYDTEKGASFYIFKHSPAPMFNLTRFLDHISGRQAYSKIVNCMDCATICATFANAVGVELSEKRMRNLSAPNKGFLCNEIQAIGYSIWKVPFQGGFSFHEVCMLEPLQEENRPSVVEKNNYYIYDACLKLDGSAHPELSGGRKPCLPLGMHFSEFGDVDHVDNIPENGSYREHLAVNSSLGIGSCRYDKYYNEEGQLTYKQVI